MLIHISVILLHISIILLHFHSYRGIILIQISIILLHFSVILLQFHSYRGIILIQISVILLHFHSYRSKILLHISIILLQRYTTEHQQQYNNEILLHIHNYIGVILLHNSVTLLHIHIPQLCLCITTTHKCNTITHQSANSASHTSGVGNGYQLRLGRQRQVWCIPLADERGCAGKTVRSLQNTCHT